MKLRLSQLRQIIKEEVTRTLREGAHVVGDDYFGVPGAPSAVEVAAYMANGPEREYYLGKGAYEAADEWDGAREGKGLKDPFVRAVAEKLMKIKDEKGQPLFPDDSAELGINSADQFFVPASPGDMSVGLLGVLKKRLGAGPYMVNNPDNFDAFDALDEAVPYNPAQRRSLGVEGDFYQVGSFEGKPVVRQDVDGGQETFFYTVG